MSTYIRVDVQNIDQEHICCALSGDDANVKKEWLKQQFAYGHTFLKLQERGKVFIEYGHCEYAFAPIEANHYMYVYCFWVSGKFAKQGHASELLKRMEEDAKQRGCNGVVCIAGKKKKPFCCDAKYLMKKGYVICDEGYDDYILLVKHFYEAKQVAFLDCVHLRKEEGFVLYYSKQCVFTNKYVPLLVKSAQEQGIEVETVLLENYEQVKKYGVISAAFSLFYNGQFITNEIMSATKFVKVLQSYEAK